MKKAILPEVGRVVQSTAGRDKDKFFVIIALEKEYAMLADGKYHKLSKPKRKKLRHIKLTDEVFTAIAEKIAKKTKVFDSELFSALKPYNNPQPIDNNHK